jgi:hypothetical protein
VAVIALPIIATVASFVIALYFATRERPTTSAYGDIGGAFILVVAFACAIIASLVAWLIWALLT